MTSKECFLTCMGAKGIPRREDEEGVKIISETLKTLLREAGHKTKKGQQEFEDQNELLKIIFLRIVLIIGRESDG